MFTCLLTYLLKLQISHAPSAYLHAFLFNKSETFHKSCNLKSLLPSILKLIKFNNNEFLWCDFLPQSYCAVLSVVLFMKRWLYLLSVWRVDEKWILRCNHYFKWKLISSTFIRAGCSHHFLIFAPFIKSLTNHLQ